MSARQIEMCAARMTPTDAAIFVAQMEAAAALFRQSVELRRAAWALYRQRTGLKAGASK